MKITLRGSFSIIVVLALNLSILGVRSLESEPVVKNSDQDDHLTETKNIHESDIVNAGSLEIHSSFSEEVATEKVEPLKSTVDEGSILKNIQVAPELSETADAVVFTLVDTAAELRNRAESQMQENVSNQTNQAHSSFEAPEEAYIVHAEPKTQVETTTEEIIEKEVNQSQIISTSSQEEPTKTAPTQHEDIPSFREWTQKQLAATAEKKKVDPNVTADKVTKSSGKFRLKNYASPDCGAKIVAANPESVSSSSVLSSSKDEYMLNYCTSRIWFIVELCESIRAKQFDLANFELFSSSPKHFTVSISHRFPTRDWSNVGKFTAKDSRDVQTFDLSPQLFGKYIKIELRSHYGKEHFCPVSWVGVYGTSEYEILAKEDERHTREEDDDDDDEDVLEIRRDAPKNLFSSATDAVLSIVKKATAPFMKAENNETSLRNQGSITMTTSKCVTPRYITVCDNCTQNIYDDVYFLLSCKNILLRDLISSRFVRRILINYESCNRYGLDFNTLRIGAPFPKIKHPNKENYLTSLLKESYVAALCNFLAVSENKVVVNTSVEMIETLKNLTEKKESCESSLIFPSSTCSIDCRSSFTEYSSSISDVVKSTERFSEKIEPTKTLSEDEVKKLSPSETESIIEQSKQTETKPVVSPTATLEPEKPEVEEPKVTFVESNDKFPENIEDVVLPPHDSTLDAIFSDINEFEKAVKSHPSSATLPPPTHLPAESIFLRLANRIKNLEINMSLSSSYLEEMSRRYRNQLEVLSKTMNLTAQKIEEQYKLEEEREKRREKELSLIRMQLANLTREVTMLLKEKNSWKIRNNLFSIFLIALIASFITITYSKYQKTPKKSEAIHNKKPRQKTKRRNSVEGIPLPRQPQFQRVRRPSDEALEIALASKFEKKRKRKKKESRVNVLVKRKRSENSNTSSDDKNLEEKTDRLEIIKTTVVEHGEVEMSNRFAPIFSFPQSKRSDPEIYYNGLPTEPVRRFSSPVFMKTALSSRNSRLKSTQSDRESSQESSVSSRVDDLNSNDTRTQKEKKSTGIKKYMKKFF